MPQKKNNKVQAFQERKDMKFDPPVSALSKWHPEIKAATGDDESTINIYSTVGDDYFTDDGITAKKVNEVLKKNKGKDITVNINSPGGSFFEGTAIYNLLRAHDGQVNVRVVGIAASAASVIAMAGDDIQIAESGFLMIHNAWTCMCGNKHDMAEVSKVLEKFDASMAGTYAKQTGIDEDEIHEMMDAESWIQGPEAVDRGFATSLLDADDVDIDNELKAVYSSALRKADIRLAKAGIPRSERRTLIKDLTGTPSAADPPTPSAGKSMSDEDELTKALSALAQTTAMQEA